jgi:hypothetical protein
VGGLPRLGRVGVYNGASMRMWRAYFGRSRVVGLDIDPRTEAYRNSGFEMWIGSQTDTDLLDKALAKDLSHTAAFLLARQKRSEPSGRFQTM